MNMKKIILPVTHTRVFSASPYGGNPCPVVFNADQLTSQEMCTIAAQFMQETVFVCSPQNDGSDVRLRYFVPNHEMEMCVHATVGCTTVLIQKGFLNKTTVQIETPLGIISANSETSSDNLLNIIVEQFPPRFSQDNPSISQVAKALGINVSDIDITVGPVQSVSTSRAKLMVPLKDSEVLNSLNPDFEYLWEICDQYETTGFYPFSIEHREESPIVSARQFPKRAGYNEDSATGVAACALGSYLVEHHVFKEKESGWHKVQINQGFSMKKPSVIYAESFVQGSEIIKTQIMGQAVIESDKTIMIDKTVQN
ncbi:PhzF family phenazine biosynthesis protein [Peribacillus sp. NPDC097895]|jgi:PhzF family phenazine biosynthesis protein|uniref:PhzF family phenazine biosynthesis protein n=1 Tax=Peribacillus sp. NPDC097895 TaxID=3390619 RepID=UPI003D05004E